MIVLDTHVLIWYGQRDAKIGSAARNLIDEAASMQGVYVPAICAWEVALIERRGDVPFPGDAFSWFNAMLLLPGFVLASLLPTIAFESVRLAWQHRDPADRQIVATARQLELPLLTADRKVLQFAEQGHVQAIDARV